MGEIYVLKLIYIFVRGARHIYPSLVLVQPRKTRPCLTERLLMGRKESNQTNKNIFVTLCNDSRNNVMYIWQNLHDFMPKAKKPDFKVV